MSEKIDISPEAIAALANALPDSQWQSANLHDAREALLALAAENAALRAENLLMAKSLDAEELRVGLSTTGGMWRFWRDKAADVVSENAALRAESEWLRDSATKLAEALRKHHTWHSEQTDVETVKGIEMVPADEYAESGLCEMTLRALNKWEAAQK